MDKEILYAWGIGADGPGLAGADFFFLVCWVDVASNVMPGAFYRVKSGITFDAMSGTAKVTAYDGKNAVTVVAEKFKWRQIGAILPSLRFAAFSEWCSCPLSATLFRSLPVEVMAEYPIQTVIQLLGQKRSRYIKTSPSGDFRSAEASLMYRPCIFTSAKRDCAVCVIQLAPTTRDFSLTYGTNVCQVLKCKRKIRDSNFLLILRNNMV